MWASLYSLAVSAIRCQLNVILVSEGSKSGWNQTFYFRIFSKPQLEFFSQNHNWSFFLQKNWRFFYRKIKEDGIFHGKLQPFGKNFSFLKFFQELQKTEVFSQNHNWRKLQKNWRGKVWPNLVPGLSLGCGDSPPDGVTAAVAPTSVRVALADSKTTYFCC